MNIPFPISILFAFAFVVAVTTILWKLHRRGRVYFVIFLLVIILEFFVLASLVIVFATNPPSGGGPVEIQITSDNTSYLSNEQIHFSIYVNNPHNWRIPHPSDISYQIDTFYSGKGINDYSFFPPHSRTLIDTYSWSDVTPGNYALTVTLRGSVNYGQSANFTVTIKPSQ